MQENNFGPSNEQFGYEKEFYKEQENIEDRMDKRLGKFSFSTFFFSFMTITLIIIALIRISLTFIQWFSL